MQLFDGVACYSLGVFFFIYVPNLNRFISKVECFTFRVLSLGL